MQSCRQLSSSAVYRKLRVSSIGKLRDKLLNGEIFDTLLEARVLTEHWRREYNMCPGLIALWDTDHRLQRLLRL